MARIFWDGERIVATAGTANIEHLTHLAEKYNAECLPGVNGYAFLRTVQTIKDLSTLEQTAIDDSFQQLLDKVNKREQADQNFINSLNLPEKMYPFQKSTVAQIVKWMHNTLIAGDPGCGKTCMASVALNVLEGAYPALIICPASLKANWEKEINFWTPNVKTFVIYGRTSYTESYILEKAKQADVVIINYDILGEDNKEAQKREKERIKKAKEEGRPYRKAFIPVSGWVDRINEVLKPHSVVCDECQAIESSKTVRTRAVIQITNDNSILKLFLSGTPFETRLSQFFTACHIMDKQLFPKEFDFKQRYCNPYWNGFGYTYDGVSHLDELKRKLDTFMIRLKKEDILPFLPKKQKIPIYFDMDKASRKSYDLMEEELLALPEMHQFAYLAKMKEALINVKLEPSIQFIKDMLDVEDKLVIFVHHQDVYDTLMNSFGKLAVGFNGTVPAIKRQSIVDKFQKDPGVKLFIGQLQAAGVGVTLTASHVVITIEWGQTAAQHLQAEDRIHRISQTSDRCLCYYLIVKDTIDEGGLASISQHYQDIKAVLDGDTSAKFLDLDASMIANVRTRRLMKGRQGVQIEY